MWVGKREFYDIIASAKRENGNRKNRLISQELYCLLAAYRSFPPVGPLSVDPVDNHQRWLKDIEETQGSAVHYPMIGDSDLAVAKLYNMLPAEEAGTSEGRTAATNQTVRSVFMIGPDKKIKLILTYPMTTGRNFDEILRVLDSMQLTATHKVATPVNWKSGDDVIIVPSVSDDEAKGLFAEGWKTLKPYLRLVKQPR